MRIAIVVERLPPQGGGGEQVAWLHATELAQRHDVAVVTFGERYEEARADGVDVVRLPRRAHGLLAYATADRASLNRCLDRFSPDIVHCHMPNVLAACLAKKSDWMVAAILKGKSLLALGRTEEARAVLEYALRLAIEQRHEAPEAEVRALLQSAQS